MTLKNIIDNLLNEGIAENIIIDYIDNGNLQSALNIQKQLLKNTANKKEFFFQYKDVNIFLERAFGMYNRKMSQGFKRDNTNFNFDKYIKPCLISFYNDL